MDMTPHFPIYLDYGATTPVDPRVVDAMIPWLREHFGNPASRSHAWGWEAEEAVEKAREQVAALINADPREIVWTSGATESNNLALKGAAHFYKTRGKHLVTVKTEHKAVLDTMRELERQGFEVTYLDVAGRRPARPRRRSRRRCVPTRSWSSVMFVNNEIGVIQDIAAIGEICRETRHHLPRRRGAGDRQDRRSTWRSCQVDLMSSRAHKTYGPKGIGALYVRRKPRVRIEAQMHGGGHERGMRSGTLPTHQIVGMGEAFRLAREEMGDRERAHPHAARPPAATACRTSSEVYRQRRPGAARAAQPEHQLQLRRGRVADHGRSRTSRCRRARRARRRRLEPSATCCARSAAATSWRTARSRFTIGRFTTEEEIDYAVELVKRTIAKLRELSPLWEMYQEGIDISTIQWAAH